MARNYYGVNFNRDGSFPKSLVSKTPNKVPDDKDKNQYALHIEEAAYNFLVFGNYEWLKILINDAIENNVILNNIKTIKTEFKIGHRNANGYIKIQNNDIKVVVKMTTYYYRLGNHKIEITRNSIGGIQMPCQDELVQKGVENIQEILRNIYSED